MINAIAFVLMFTNPLGTPPQLGYPNPVYQRYTVAGEQPKVYTNYASCVVDLTSVKTAEYAKLNREQSMPAYRTTMRARLESLQCLPEGSKPEPAMRSLPLKPQYVWRIGRMGQDLYFKGQSLDMRQFIDRGSCEAANRNLQDRLNTASLHRQSATGSLMQRDEIITQYKCYQVIPITSYEARTQLLPPMVPHGAYLPPNNAIPRY